MCVSRVYVCLCAGSQPDQKDAWRCPVCRWAYDRIPSAYRCFCGKVTNPEWQPQQLHVPHSCGRLCQRPLATDPRSFCRHTCTLPCHPGPCPQCPVMVARKCPCGRKRCVCACVRACMHVCMRVCMHAVYIHGAVELWASPICCCH